MTGSVLYELNHSPLWQRRLSVWDHSVRAASLDRLVFLALHRLGWMGSEDAELLRDLVRPGMQILDVGANIGLYSLLLAQLTGDGGRVYAFEPEPNLHAVLRDNCTANRARNVELFQCAAGNFNGSASFQRSTFNSGNNSLGQDAAGALEVKVAKIDDVLPVAAIDFIKLDVQGHELGVLRGSEQLLRRSPAVQVLFEFWPAGLRAAGTEPGEVGAFFAAHGFTLHTTEGAEIRPLRDLESLATSLRPKRYTNLLARRPSPAAR